MTSRSTMHLSGILGTLALSAAFAALPALAQQPSSQSVPPTEIATTLPDAPSYSASASTADRNAASSDATPEDPGSFDITPIASPRRVKRTSRYDKYIDDIEIPQPLTSRDKVILGARAVVTPYTFLSVIASAGFEQGRNSSPNYGTDSGAYGQRIAAAAARDTSEILLTNSVFAPIFHQDPRYYELGQGHTVFARTTYAATRVLISRTDDGRPMPNYAMFAGFAAAFALTNAYYPPINRGFSQNAESFGTSLGTSAFSYIVREFIDEAMYSIHMSKNKQ